MGPEIGSLSLLAQVGVSGVWGRDTGQTRFFLIKGRDQEEPSEINFFMATAMRWRTYPDVENKN